MPHAAPSNTRPRGLVPELPAGGRAAVRGGVWGNYVDQINIFLPVTALAPALATVAGPHANATTAAIVVAATLVGRPLGAMIFGHLSDRVGRTATTKVAISGTAACSLGIALVPGFEVLGAVTIGVIIALRFIGGAFLAGEYTSAIPLAMEWSTPRRRGLVSGRIMSMAPWAQGTIALLTVVLLSVLGPVAYAQFGWRLSFGGGAAASLIMLFYYSRRVADAPIYTRRRVVPEGDDKTTVGLPDVLFGRWAGAFWQVFALMSGLWFCTNMVVIVVTSRLPGLGLAPTQAALVMAIASVAQALVMAWTGHWSTFTGRRRFFIAGGVVAAVSGPALWYATVSSHGVLAIAACVAAMQVLTVSQYGPVGAYINERFPTSVRATAYGTAYSLSIVVPALYPLYVPTLSGLLGRDVAVAGLLALGGALIAIGGASGPRLADLDHDLETTARLTRAGARQEGSR